VTNTPALPTGQATKSPATREEIDAFECSDAIRAGLHLIRDGVVYREAEARDGLASHKDLHVAPKQLGLLSVHTRELVARCKRVADLSAQEIERRLEDDPQSVDMKTLAVVHGIAMDKVARFENWGSRLHDPTASASQFLDRLSQLEGKIQITVERTPPDERHALQD
jgi:hypothetical protein